MVSDQFNTAEQSVSDLLLERVRKATLGIYEIAGELGRGGMAVVYVGHDLKLQRTVAIKVMDPRLNLAHGMADRFLQEARTAARVQHPNIIVIHDILRTEELIFFIMGLVEGGGLDEVCRDTPVLPIDQAKWILLQASRALAHAHSEHVIHRDVKPANILINVKGNVVLTDFGIAKSLGSDGLTKSGTQVGTPTYMSPEQFGERPVDGSTDQYALGVTAYQLLTGRTPFAGDLYQLIAAHVSKTPTHIRELRPDCPAYLANAVMRMLEKEPENRWPSMEDLEGVFGANLAIDGGTARRQLAQTAQRLQQHRNKTVDALSARVPVSPVPVNGGKKVTETLVVTISPPDATIFVGGTLSLSATVSRESGDTTIVPVVWSSDDHQVVTVTESGTVSGVGPGTTTVRATAIGTSEVATIRCERAPIARVTVSTPRITLHAGDIVQPTVSVIDVNGTVRNDISLTWTSRAPSVAVLDTPGTIRAVTPGETQVEVTAANARRVIDVIVTPRPVAVFKVHSPATTLEVGDATALRIEALDDRGNVVELPNVRWRSTSPSVVHVDSAGTALALGPGEAGIIAQAGELRDEIKIFSVEGAIGAIEILLPAATIETGEEEAITLRVTDQNGAVRSSSGIRVWSSAPNIAQVENNGVTIRGVAVGSTQIHAAPEHLVGQVKPVSATIHVRPPAVSRIDVTPRTLELEVGSLNSIDITCFDKRGKRISDVTPQYSSANADIATINTAGAIHAIAPGVTEIRVSIPGSPTPEVGVLLRVRKPSIARVAIVADRTTLVAGESTELAVTAWDASGANAADYIPKWRSEFPGILQIGRDGHVTALAPGRGAIAVSVDGCEHRVEIVVVPSPLAALAILTPTAPVITGVPIQLSAEGTDQSGNKVVAEVVWRVSPPHAATISADGMLLPSVATRFTVTATIAGTAAGNNSNVGVREANIVLEARAARIESLKFDRDSVTLKLNEHRAVPATAVLEGKQTAALDAVSYSSSNDAIVRVDSTGLLRAVALGECVVTASAGELRAGLRIHVRESKFPALAPRLFAVVGVLLVCTSAGALWITRDPKVENTGPSGAAPTETAARDSLARDSVQRLESLRIAAARVADSTRVADSVRLALDGQRRQGGRTGNAATDSALLRAALLNAERVRVAAETRRRDSMRRADSVGTVQQNAAAVLRRQQDSTRAADSIRNAQSQRATEVADSVRRAEAARARTETAAPELPNLEDVRATAERIVADIRRGARTNDEVRRFLSDAEASVTLVAPATIVSSDAGRVQMQFDIRLSARSAAGILNRRESRVVVDLGGSRGAPEIRSVQIGPLRRP